MASFGQGVATPMNRNKITFRLLKSSIKCNKTGEKMCKNLQKNLHFPEKFLSV